jgi:hypothetical protein
MAGKNTAKNGPHASGGGWVAHHPLKISSEVAKELSGALGRPLVDKEVSAIERGLAIQLSIKASHDDKVSWQSVKRTLKYIADCAADDVHEAYRNCDTATGAEIDCALSVVGIHESSAATAAAIQCAAREALNSIMARDPVQDANARGYQAGFARWCIRVWKAHGGTQMTVWHKREKDGSHSHLVNWAVALFSVIERRDFDPKKAADLLRAAQE